MPSEDKPSEQGKSHFQFWGKESTLCVYKPYLKIIS